MLILIFVLFKSTVKDVFSDNRKTFCELSCTSEMLANLHNLLDRKNRLNKLHSSYHLLLIILSHDVQYPGPKQLNVCRICSGKFSTNVELVKCQTCPRCDMVLTTKHRYNLHIAKCKGICKYKCPECEEDFFSHFSIENHMNYNSFL